MRMYRCHQVTPRTCLKILAFLLLQLLILLVVQEMGHQLIFQKDSQRCDKETWGVGRNGEDVPRNLASEDLGTGPLRFVRENGVVTDLSSLQVNKMTTDQLLMTMHSYLDNVDVVCQRKVRMGRIDEGGWEVCDDPDVRPRDPCIIYSFGINNDFSFDDDAAKMYGCHVYSFDPSMAESAYHYNRSSNVHFYRIGLSGATHVTKRGWPLFTLTDIRQKLGHRNVTIDVIKMDIEGWEWGALPQMIREAELQGARQLLVEYHLSRDDRRYLLPRVKVVQGLERSGFRKFYVHKNRRTRGMIQGFPVVRTRCYEVHYLRR